jgi:hypothetical protein
MTELAKTTCESPDDSLTDNDKLLQFCQQHGGGVNVFFVMFVTVMTLGLGLILFALGYLISRMTPLGSGVVQELIQLLKSEDEIRIGRKIYTKRNGVIYPGDLAQLENHLLNQAEKKRERECHEKLGIA